MIFTNVELINICIKDIVNNRFYTFNYEKCQADDETVLHER